MIESTLSDQFQNSRGEPISIGGQMAYPIYKFGMQSPKKLKIEWRSTKSNFRQGIQAKIDNGVIEVNEQVLSNVILWEDTSPSVVLLKCIPSKKTMFKIWNVWEVDGITQAWVGNSGMRISESNGETILSCSDGIGEVSFENMVFGLQQ